MVTSIVYTLVIILGALTMFTAYRHYKGDQILSVQTGSMVPSFYPGDALVTRKVIVPSLQIGDIVTYHNPSDPKVLVSHRLIGINYRTGKLITHGDALDLQDVPFPSNLLVGKVYKVVPLAGFMLDWLHKPAGLIVAIYIPASLILISEARRLARHYSKPYYRLYSYGLKH